MKRHRWMVFAPFEVTPEDARRMATGEGVPDAAELAPTQIAADEVPDADDTRPFLGLHNIVHELIAVGCFDCEQGYSDEVEAAGCPADPQPVINPDRPKLDFRGVGRNERCPCGSGKKYKHCHGAS